jgi:hypothetical protein
MSLKETLLTSREREQILTHEVEALRKDISQANLELQLNSDKIASLQNMLSILEIPNKELIKSDVERSLRMQISEARQLKERFDAAETFRATLENDLSICRSDLHKSRLNETGLIAQIASLQNRISDHAVFESILQVEKSNNSRLQKEIEILRQDLTLEKNASVDYRKRNESHSIDSKKMMAELLSLKSNEDSMKKELDSGNN